MIDVFSLMLWPLLACFVLVGIHAYLGLHIIARKVIFVDLALAQIAALGAVYAVFLGFSFETNPLIIKTISVAFTFFGALVFAFTRKKDEKIPQEAIIGIIYAATLSLTLLFTANLPHGGEDVQQMLAGNILWVTPNEVSYTALLYAGVGIIHYIFRKPFFSLSQEMAHKIDLSPQQKLWDFLFYATFGLVVTSSVGIGGVLLVFGYLVIPSVIAVMLADSIKMRLLIAWGSGVLVSIIGVVLSYHLDLPSGPTIVVLLGASLIVVSIVVALASRSIKSALWQVSLLAFLLVLVALSLALRGYFEEQNEEHIRRHQLGHKSGDEEKKALLKTMLASSRVGEIAAALNEIKEHRLSELMPEVLLFLSHADSKIRELSVKLFTELSYKEALPTLKQSYVAERDEFLKIEKADAIAVLGDPEGLFLLAAIASESGSSLAREDAIMHLSALLKNAPADPSALLRWLEKHRRRLVFDELEHKYSG